MWKRKIVKNVEMDPVGLCLIINLFVKDIQIQMGLKSDSSLKIAERLVQKLYVIIQLLAQKDNFEKEKVSYSFIWILIG